LAEPDRFRDVIGVDHDPAVAATRLEEVVCFDYLERPFPHCYDEHDGTDFLLVGGFDAMDAGSPAVLAAAPGVVVAAEDGHYDRCHGTIEGVSCDGNDGVANSVVVEHEGGMRTLYWHLQRGSVVVEVGQAVDVGEPLGAVGSSGYSSLPHLHFEVQDEAGDSLDPFAGPASQATSWWCDQGAPDGLPSADCHNR
jgi:murein DD-endopeptidase MepM/ murein hydrolase activator NlpD